MHIVRSSASSGYSIETIKNILAKYVLQLSFYVNKNMKS